MCFARAVAACSATLLIPRLPSAYAIWMGANRDVESFKAEYLVDDVRYADEIDAVLSELAPEVVYVNYGKSSDSGNWSRAGMRRGVERHWLYHLVS